MSFFGRNNINSGEVSDLQFDALVASVDIYKLDSTTTNVDAGMFGDINIVELLLDGGSF